MHMAIPNTVVQGEVRIVERLRAVQLRPTSARIGILQLLTGGGQASLNAEDVYQQLQDSGIAVSLGTIYRVLRELEAVGLLLREREDSASGNKARYWIKPEHAEEGSCYFVCRVCERKVLVQDEALMQQLRQVAQVHGMQAGGNLVSMQMRCSHCSDVASGIRRTDRLARSVV
ncbi:MULTISPECIES: Fur family transcriptional regulator [unclassified Janthinobacterium]|uniref:Fur family transcriptional regulator n=1 Tax=unclassified Janthinobacterium TaxID=2610881 RepID=UPI0016203DBE|nr:MULTISPECIES: transcriptional repressor [unclassified Janthinobacterium]MBB5607216.1 Fur family ferric uptake transcriptional regulator [Janthinobacterium sp. S3T4]MBB5612941.1 Fur family ferric uptake transcriptional regulator [Janthinobacterium sp. S3M3]